ncbi:unnamed protein product [Clonostachys byssicola]|uniref:Uncharacterized protein n=1 Tax=Clonostachys byssicola TaxID=160290 RepID=A0A9N9UNZ1_9HYPO|nr:unnamed protein product [Clonostachys byssicola]
MPPKRKSSGTAPPPKKRGKNTTDAPPESSASGPAPPEEPGNVDEQAWERLYESRSIGRKYRWSEVSGSKNLDENYFITTKNPTEAYEFVCQCNPVKKYDDDEDDDEDDEDDEENPGDGEEGQAAEAAKKCDEGKTCSCGKTAASLPSHPYTLTRAGIAKYHNAQHMIDLRNPDAFSMYTFNDHMAYGSLEVVQNLLLDFEEARHDKMWREAWAVTEAMALFMVIGAGGDMCMADDGDMIQATAHQIMRMALTSLAILESEGKLTEASSVKNIGWIIGLYLKMTDLFRDMGLAEEEPQPSKAKAFKFRYGNFELYLRVYARRCNVTIPDESSSPSDTDLTMPKESAKDPWSWTRSFSEYQGCFAPYYAYRGAHRRKVGGDGLDITTWTSAERKAASFDKKDPLNKTAIKNLKEGNVLVLA